VLTVSLNATDVIEPTSPLGETLGKDLSASVGTYSTTQQKQVARLTPIKYCCYPEFYLKEDAPSEFMPQDIWESDAAYEVRKTRACSSFEPFYAQLRDIIVGTALRKGIKTETTEKEWQDFIDNVDLEGNSLSSFAKKNFSDSIDGGIGALWVEYPVVPDNINSIEEARLGLRPYLVSITCSDILEVRAEIKTIEIAGKPVLGNFPAYVRLKTTYEVVNPQNRYQLISYPAVREYDLVVVEDEKTKRSKTKLRCTLSYKKSLSDDEYIVVGAPVLASIPFIPFVPVYGGKVEGYCMARPQLLDTARLNLNHWVMAADLAFQMHNTSSEHKYATGVRSDEKLNLESDKMLIAESADAKFGMLSPRMDGADAILKNLERIEKSMERLAAVALTTGRTQSESGFSKILDRSQSDSQLAILVSSLEDSYRLAFSYAYHYIGKDVPEVSISKDFIPVKLHSQQVQAYINMWEKTPLPIRLLLEVFKAGELYEGIPGFEVDDILQQVGLTGKETFAQINPNQAMQTTRTLVGAMEGAVSESNGESGIEVPESMDVAQVA
jgi:hypothetical protein